MTQQGRRTSVEGEYVGVKRRGRSLKKLAVLPLGLVGRVERREDTYYGRLKLGEAILYQCRNRGTYLSGRASFLPIDKALRE